MDKLWEGLLKTRLRERELVNILWIGFSIYTLSYTISTTTYVNYVVCQVFQIIGLVLLLPSFFSLLKYRFESTYLQILFTGYLIWIAITVIRGFQPEYSSMKFFLFDAWFGGILYLTPLFLLLPGKLFYLRRTFNVIIVLAIFYIIYDIAFIGNLMSQEEGNVINLDIVEYFSKTLSVPSFFLLMSYRYQSGRKKIFLIFVFALTVFFGLVRARRGLLVMCALAFIFSYLLYIAETRQKFFTIFISVIVGAILLFVGFEFFTANNNGLFDYITDRGLEDTRSTVEICFYQSMGFQDWIIGKGMGGEYFCPGIDPNDLTGYRGTIETDYLQFILKGGLISVLFFLLITIPAIFKGLFYSDNLLSKVAGLWILWILLNMYPSTINTFTMEYILLWLSVGICYSKTIRTMPDQILKDYFLSNSKYIEEE